MTFGSFTLILRRQFTHKWGRFLLASGGIMIGIWAITLTSSLSLGLSNTIIKAINSQPSAKEFSLSRTSDGKTSFLDITEAPKIVAIGDAEVNTIRSKNPDIVGISPANNILNVYQLKNNESCIQLNKKATAQEAVLAVAIANGDSQVDATKLDSQSQSSRSDLIDRCKTLSIDSKEFSSFYESNRTKWSGKTSKPSDNEIVVCFKCGSLDFYKSFDAKEPKDLLNKEITLEYQSAPEAHQADQIVDTLNSSRGSNQITQSKIINPTIVAVIDDRESNSFGGGNTNFYFGENYYKEAIKLQNPNFDTSKIGFTSYNVVVNSYDNLNKVLDSLKADKYLPISLTESIVNGVKIFFQVVTIVLSLLGLIALIASVFGIINVMTISVLERQKEIGILKSLGAKNSDIFSIFLLESALLGLLGWILGTGLAVAMGLILSAVSKAVINSNPEWKTNLETLNIQSFSPEFPWWLLLGTLFIALLFTILSGVFPAVKASKQNPVDVLRAE